MENNESKINELEKENDLLNKKINEIEDKSYKVDGAKDLPYLCIMLKLN